MSCPDTVMLRAIYAKEKFTLQTDELDSIIEVVRTHSWWSHKRRRRRSTQYPGCLQKGHPEDPRPVFSVNRWSKGRVDQFKLLEMVPKTHRIQIHERVYIVTANARRSSGSSAGSATETLLRRHVLSPPFAWNKS
jgi:hypothetical protein